MPAIINCIVLAAGCSSRFGTTKLLAKIGDESMIRRVVKSVSSSRVSSVYVVAGHDAARVSQEIIDLCDGIVVNSEYRSGMGSSIASGINSLPANSDGALIVLGDQPLVSPANFDALIEAWSKKRSHAVLSRHAGVLSPPSLFPRSMFPRLESLRGDVGARSSLGVGEYEVVEFDSAWPLTDIDTREDLKKL